MDYAARSIQAKPPVSMDGSGASQECWQWGTMVGVCDIGML